MRRLPLISFLLIASLSIIVYFNALDNGFHYDDEHDIVSNSFLKEWGNIPLFFTGGRFYRDEILRTDHYRPLVYVTYALTKITGVNYITARSSVMSGLFYLLAFYFWVKYRSQETEYRGKKLEVRSKTISDILPLTSNFSPGSSSASTLT